jgi:hypothetical protein
MHIAYDRPASPTVSIILLDWGVRESFHSLTYLNRQDIDRSTFEILWVEYYDHVPEKLDEQFRGSLAQSRPLVDQWIVLGAPREAHVHKHYCYNVGIALARGRICVICDSDAIYPSNFVRRLIDCFEGEERLVVHLDQIRNENRRYYPFSYPNPDELLADPMSINWDGGRTRGLLPGADRLHEANYGACMAAQRDALIGIGGADEHIDYLGYICGPYELTFRLVNEGFREWWLNDLFTIHTWHPSAGGAGNVAGPSDGRGISRRALEAKQTHRVLPFKENSALAILRADPHAQRDAIIPALEATDFSLWCGKVAGLQTLDPPQLVHQGIRRHNIIRYGGLYYAVPQSDGPFLPEMADQREYREKYVHGADVDEVVRRVPRIGLARRGIRFARRKASALLGTIASIARGSR